MTDPHVGLTDRIEKRIRAIPADNPMYISATSQTLGRILDADLIRKIAEEAAIEAALTNFESVVAAMTVSQDKGK